MLRLCYRVNYKQISAVFRSFYRTFLVLLVFLVFNVLKCILFAFGQHICMEYHFWLFILYLGVFYIFMHSIHFIFMFFMWELLLAKRNAISLAKIRQIFLQIFFPCYIIHDIVFQLLSQYHSVAGFSAETNPLTQD